MPYTTTKPTRSRRRRAQSPRARTSKRRGGFGFGLRVPPLLVSDPVDMFYQDPFFTNASQRRPPLTSILHCDPKDPSCTSSSHSSSYSYTRRDGKAADVTHKESFERRGKDAQGKPTFESKNVDYATQDGKTVRDTFQHYKLGEDTQGKYVHVIDPTGAVVGKRHVEGKLSIKDKAGHVVNLINKHPQKLGPHLREGAVAFPAAQSDDECTSIAEIVQKTFDAGQPSPTKRASTLSRKQSRSRSSSSKPRARARRSSSKTRRAH